MLQSTLLTIQDPLPSQLHDLTYESRLEPTVKTEELHQLVINHLVNGHLAVTEPGGHVPTARLEHYP